MALRSSRRGATLAVKDINIVDVTVRVYASRGCWTAYHGQCVDESSEWIQYRLRTQLTVHCTQFFGEGTDRNRALPVYSANDKV